MSDRERDRDEQREIEEKKREGVEADPHGTGSFIKKPPAFVVGIILSIIIFYVVAIYYAFQAYKEFKGIAEDTAGGPSFLNEGANIMAYGTLETRQQRDQARGQLSQAQRQANRRNNYDGQQNRRAFQGRGQMLGGE